eukprot:TRINITY_DN8808_c0_g1_i1.p1 TRINITY_DN8808_c0_g1~~TRINITY_DN8808_c0_g1_i1.p1  ORF type:complete len:363 (+),score=78.33 TRINITY_DN8808_c0_g1_i1:188-1276(+)
MLVDAQLLGSVSDGPQWDAGSMQDTCRRYWWTNVLFINNLHPTDLAQECVAQSWYLANDFQFFIFFLPFLFLFVYFAPLRERFWVRCSIVITVIVGSCIAAVSTAYYYELSSTLAPGQHSEKDPDGKQQGYFYVRPHIRVGAYAVGVLAGMILYWWRSEYNPPLKEVEQPLTDKPLADLEHGSDSKFSALAADHERAQEHQECRVTCLCSRSVAGGYLVILLSLAMMGGILLALNDYYKDPDHTWSRTQNALYMGLGRVAWSIAVAAVMLACAVGAVPLVNDMMSLPIFVPLSKLSYGVYVLHITVLLAVVNALRTEPHYTDEYAIFVYMGTLCVSYILAALLFVLVDTPVAIMETKFIGRM